ncbi:hypothetical protein ACXGQW_01180 [Wenyingzhuangia sp. IMCC45533]
MNRIFSLLCGCLLFTSLSNAQYTNVINASKPGNTETPYAVGTNVFQFENKAYVENNEQNRTTTKSFGNEFNFRYGFWKEQLEASLVHEFRSSEIGGINDTGTEVLAVGLKYMVFDYRPKETVEMTRSWKKRHSFLTNGLIPTVAVSAHFNTPLTNSSFGNSGSSFSTAIITQNHVSKKLRVNNQFEYKFIGSDLPEFVYSLSGSYVLFRRFNPYTEFKLHQLSPSNADSFKYYSVGTGIPFLINRNLAVAANFNYNFGELRGSEFGIHATYRIDRHKDKWIDVKGKKDDDDEAEISKPEQPAEKEFKKEAFLDEIVDTKKQERARKRAEKAEAKRKKREEKLKKKKEEVDDALLSY